ncbi:MAG: hypothetical protein CVU90_14555 [Firmicutes bacterium HGW-Firmicutes-15]|nr:MAG: hypothetical protein CVU90_14555 [Firmicutes bacterium HGW-Firmicutes-15]
MRLYWQFDYLTDFGRKTRYFYGTEAAAQRRIKKYKCDMKGLRNLSKTTAQYLKMEKKAHFIDL